MISSGVIRGAPIVLLLGGGLLAGHDALVRVLDALLPNLVDIAGERLGLHCSAAVFGNQLVHVVQLLLIVVGNSNGFLVGVQNDTHGLFPPIKRKNVRSCDENTTFLTLYSIYIYIYIYSSVFQHFHIKSANYTK